jgi:hypothetical protein
VTARRSVSDASSMNAVSMPCLCCVTLVTLRYVPMAHSYRQTAAAKGAGRSDAPAPFAICTSDFPQLGGCCVQQAGRADRSSRRWVRVWVRTSLWKRDQWHAGDLQRDPVLVRDLRDAIQPPVNLSRKLRRFEPCTRHHKPQQPVDQ